MIITNNQILTADGKFKKLTKLEQELVNTVIKLTKENDKLRDKIKNGGKVKPKINPLSRDRTNDHKYPRSASGRLIKVRFVKMSRGKDGQMELYDRFLNEKVDLRGRNIDKVAEEGNQLWKEKHLRG